MHSLPRFVHAYSSTHCRLHSSATNSAVAADKGGLAIRGRQASEAAHEQPHVQFPDDSPYSKQGEAQLPESCRQNFVRARP